MKKIIIVKAGGELLKTPQTQKKILAGLSKLSLKNYVVFVHGGGPQIESELAKRKIPSKFINGRRFTSPQAIEVIEQVLSGQINKSIVATLTRQKYPAVGLSCRDGGIIIAKPLPQLGRAGRPFKINISLITCLLKAGFIPVLSSIGSDLHAQPININADDVASALACELKAAHLILLTNISGVHNSSNKRIPVLKTSDIDPLIRQNVITGGMIPKVQSAKQAIYRGVGEVDIVNGFYGLSFKHGTRIIPS